MTTVQTITQVGAVRRVHLKNRILGGKVSLREIVNSEGNRRFQFIKRLTGGTILVGNATPDNVDTLGSGDIFSVRKYVSIREYGPRTNPKEYNEFSAMFEEVER
jgi:hypothetical protein